MVKTSERKSSRWGKFNSFVDITLATLKPAEVRVWLVLFRDVKPNGIARTGQTDIARRSGLSIRMVKYTIASLIKRRLVKVVRKGRLNSGPSCYRVRAFDPDKS